MRFRARFTVQGSFSAPSWGERYCEVIVNLNESSAQVPLLLDGRLCKAGARWQSAFGVFDAGASNRGSWRGLDGVLVHSSLS